MQMGPCLCLGFCSQAWMLSSDDNAWSRNNVRIVTASPGSEGKSSAWAFQGILDSPVLPGDGDVVNNMYEPDPDLLASQSAEEETEDSILSPIPMGPPSPFPTSEDFTPKEGSPYEAPVYIPEDIPVPPDLELRESSIPGAGLGIWAKRKMEVGERFGPYVLAPRAVLKEANFGWEPMLMAMEVSSREGCSKKVGDCVRATCPLWSLGGLTISVVPELRSVVRVSRRSGSKVLLSSD
ncbi:PR domain zinc finger protein 16 [Fukomys damarensis]|uniref:PR domain zinc finger protein 16 n=1 Tax=Fukomys damarensis TaxID=885580 RepID=A0A091DMV8_FUKDA|nr:PR domain zinc finger protein 16 [Fukomys damarensis]